MMLTGSLKNCSMLPYWYKFHAGAGRGISLDAMVLFFRFQEFFFWSRLSSRKTKKESLVQTKAKSCFGSRCGAFV